ncbi:MAG: hypothetical protein M1820_009579 [Bogoriella megaspora]|nr:MAG: hypothetical protein M1820_009579 [Bogoriella megaspora]
MSGGCDKRFIEADSLSGRQRKGTEIDQEQMSSKRLSPLQRILEVLRNTSSHPTASEASLNTAITTTRIQLSQDSSENTTPTTHDSPTYPTRCDSPPHVYTYEPSYLKYEQELAEKQKARERQQLARQAMINDFRVGLRLRRNKWKKKFGWVFDPDRKITDRGRERWEERLKKSQDEWKEKNDSMIKRRIIRKR